MARNGRPPNSVVLFREAVRDQNLESAIWAILYSLKDDIGRGEVDSVALKMMSELVTLEKTKIQYGSKQQKADGKEGLEALAAWLHDDDEEGAQAP